MFGTVPAIKQTVRLTTNIMYKQKRKVSYLLDKKINDPYRWNFRTKPGRTCSLIDCWHSLRVDWLFGKCYRALKPDIYKQDGRCDLYLVLLINRTQRAINALKHYCRSLVIIYLSTVTHNRAVKLAPTLSPPRLKQTKSAGFATVHACIKPPVWKETTLA